MKILKMIGIVVAIHAVVLVFGFALPGCQSTVRTSPGSATTPSPTYSSRIEAARAQTPVGQQGTTQTTRTTTNSGYTNTGYTATQPAYVPPPASTAAATYSSGIVTDFGAPVVSAGVAPARPQDTTFSASPSAQVDKPAPLTYTVVSGDSASKIAKKFNIATSSLIAANKLSTNNPKLQIGQKLVIPVKTVSQNGTLVSEPQTSNYPVESAIAPTIAATTTPKASGTSIVHVVKPGESLGTIARFYGASVTEIGTVNHITNPKLLRDGTKLTIPNATKNLAGATPATPSTATASVSTPMPATTIAPTSTTPAPVDTLSTPTFLPTDSPVSPISPANDSPISTPPSDLPPVVQPQDPVSPVIPQN